MKQESGKELLRNMLERDKAESATGCAGCGDYRDYARAQGYQHLKVWDWTSSAGDWSFLVSKDGKNWTFMFQHNNYPRPGFSYSFEANPVFAAEDEETLFAMVAQYIEQRFN